MTSLVRASDRCRGCHGPRLERVFSLGDQPPANAFLGQEQLADSEPSFPLDVEFCLDCSLVQLRHAVAGEILFSNYVYNSSTSPVFVKHFQDFQPHVSRITGLPQDGFVVDIGSNDGILLRPFLDAGHPVLGIDPAENIARMASAAGVETWARFFTPEAAREIVAKKGNAPLVTATNSFAHIEDLDGVVEGIDVLMSEDGAFVLEVAYLQDLIEQSLFDTVYHEHLYYWSVKPLVAYLRRFGLEIFRVQHVETHGGSLRAYAQRVGVSRRIDSSVASFLEEEERRGLHDVATFHAFARSIEANKAALLTMLQDLKAEGKRIAAYGAPAKGNTLLNYFGIGPSMLDYVVDDAPLKQGLYTPGTHIPVVPGTRLLESPPDYILILAWNFAEPIMRKLDSYRTAGGAFIVPVPQPHIVR